MNRIISWGTARWSFLSPEHRRWTRTSRPRAENSTTPAICRQLDGIPLAIEFAAARAATLGIQHVAVGLAIVLRC